MEERRAVLALNGQKRGTINDYRQIINYENSFFVAADGGAVLLEEIGFLPHVIIGDMDSLSHSKIKQFREKGIKIIKHPIDKDETDGELALDYCYHKGFKKVVLIGSIGGRFDQQLANIFLLEYAHKVGLDAVVKEPDIEIGLIHKKKYFFNQKGKGLSLLPLNEEVKGVFTDGCKYSLNNEDLFRYRTRGISNLIIQDNAEISVEEGLLLYILNEHNFSS